MDSRSSTGGVRQSAKNYLGLQVLHQNWALPVFGTGAFWTMNQDFILQSFLLRVHHDVQYSKKSKVYAVSKIL